MLSTELSTGLLFVSLLCALGSLGVSFVAMQFALRNKRSDREYRDLVLHLAELEDLHEALAASHKRLRSRVGMRELRAKRRNGDDPPEDQVPLQSVDDWKKQARIELREKGILK